MIMARQLRETTVKRETTIQNDVSNVKFLHISGLQKCKLQTYSSSLVVQNSLNPLSPSSAVFC